MDLLCEMKISFLWELDQLNARNGMQVPQGNSIDDIIRTIKTVLIFVFKRNIRKSSDKYIKKLLSENNCQS